MENLNEMPREDGIDHSLGLLKDGYHFILNRRQELHSDVFETRLLGMKVICMGGKEAAKLFYDQEKFQRKNAAPNRVIQTLFGINAVQTLDGEEHIKRKQMFMSMLSGEKLTDLIKAVEKQWEKAIEKWEQMDQIILYEEVKGLLCRAAFEWTGVPVEEKKIGQFTEDLAAMFESAAKVGPKHWQGRTARNRVERYIEGIIEQVRSGKLTPPKNSVLQHFSSFRDQAGVLLEPITVAVEIINTLRPIVAISVYINFIILALNDYPKAREKVKNGDETYIKMFIEEVRRFYPFFPFAAALVKQDFTCNNYEFKEGTLTMLDLYGTNHDPKIWDNPDQFNPERFKNREDNQFDFIPQGGGEYETGHRCPGEMATIEIMKVSLMYITKHMEYQIPEQDLSYSLVKMPSIPESKIVLKNVMKR